MRQVRIKNANGYDSLNNYPFPVVVPVNPRFDGNTPDLRVGLVEVKCSHLISAAPEWTPPSWWRERDTLIFSAGSHFESEIERNGWEPVDYNPFAFWNMLKASRDVGAAW